MTPEARKASLDIEAGERPGETGSLRARVPSSVRRLAAELPDTGRSAPLAAVSAARDLARTVEEAVRAAVEDARKAGHTWQEIGAVLGTSRQAAFQRFGRPVDPRTGVPMADAVVPGVAEHAVEVLAELADGHWERARRDFDATMLVEIGPRRLAAGWAQVVGLVGSYQHMGEPFVHQAGDYTVVDVPLYFEAGEMNGQVSYDHEGRVAGLFLTRPGTHLVPHELP